MLKSNQKVLAVLAAAGIVAIGIVQYLAISGLIPVPALARVHWIFLPAYSIGGAFGVLFQWFLIAVLIVYIMSEVAKRKREGDPAGSKDAPSEPSPAPRRPETVQRTAPSFGRKSRI